MKGSSRPPVVTLLGDSIVEGYGLRPEQSLSERLSDELSRQGVICVVRNAGVSGDATRDGLARLDKVAADTDLCVVALGANDLLQAVEPTQVEANLDDIVHRLLARRFRVLLCGLRAPPWRPAYSAAFDAVFSAVAYRHGVPLVPFLLEGVALRPDLNLPDRIHPNARGVEVIARHLAPAVLDALR